MVTNIPNNIPNDKDPITAILEVQPFAVRSEIHRAYREDVFSLVKGLGYSLVCNRYQYELDSLYFVTVGTFAHWSIGKTITPPDLGRETKSFYNSIKNLNSTAELIYMRQQKPLEQRLRMLNTAIARNEERNIVKLSDEINEYNEAIAQALPKFKEMQQDAHYERLAIDMDEIVSFWNEVIVQHGKVIKEDVPYITASLKKHTSLLQTTYRIPEKEVLATEPNRYLSHQSEWPVQYPDLSLVTQFPILDESYDPTTAYPPTSFTF